MVILLNHHMRPSRKPDGEGGPNVETFQRIVIIPGIGKNTPEYEEKYRHEDQVGVGVNKRHILRPRNAVDLWGHRTEHTISKSSPTPRVSVHGPSGTTRQGVGLSRLVETRLQGGKSPTLLRCQVALGSSCLFYPSQFRGQVRVLCEPDGLVFERLTCRSPAERAVASGLGPFCVGLAFDENCFPMGLSFCNEQKFSSPFADLSSPGLILDSRLPEKVITSVHLQAIRRYESFLLGKPHTSRIRTSGDPSFILLPWMRQNRKRNSNYMDFIGCPVLEQTRQLLHDLSRKRGRYRVRTFRG
jgi:hypothetical protein